MEQIRLTQTNIGKCAARAAEVLRAGGVILYPTDTLYGLGVDALSDDAVSKVYAIKGRSERKPIHCITADMEMAKRYAEVGNFARLLAEEFLPGPLTLVLKKSAQGRSASGGKTGRVITGIFRGLQTIGIRIPDNEFCLALAREFDGPVTTTSANKAGVEPERSIKSIVKQLGKGSSIDLAIDAGELRQSRPSTVVDLSGKEPVIVREGAIAAADVWNALRTEL